MENVIVNLNYELLFLGIILPILLGCLLGICMIREDNKKKYWKDYGQQEPKLIKGRRKSMD